MKLNKIGIVARGNDAHAHQIAAQFAKLCKRKSITPFLSADSLETIAQDQSALAHMPKLDVLTLEEIGQQAEACVVLGGDGTFLGAAAGLYKSKNCSLVGINLGHLGFLTDIPIENLEELIFDLQNDKLKPQTRDYYLATLCDNQNKCWQQPFLNDAVIQRNADEKMVRFEVDSGQWRVASTRADGLIISTPTGSTAYNLSAGGPIMHPDIDALVIAPICPHNLAFRPVVVPPKEIRIKLLNYGHLSIDGRQSHIVNPGDTVLIEKAPFALQTLVHHDFNFFDVLREKFGWDRSLQTNGEPS